MYNRVIHLYTLTHTHIYIHIHIWASLMALPELDLWVGKIPWKGDNGNPLQYSCLENPHGQRSLVGYSPWGHKALDMIE